MEYSDHVSSLSSHPLSVGFWFLVPILVSFTLLKFLKHEKSNERKHPLPPGPKPWPIIGNLPEMVANKPPFRWTRKLMNDFCTDILCIRLGNVHVITVTSSAIAREMLVKQDAVFASRPLNWTSEYSSRGYKATAPAPYGEQWKKLKKVITNELISPLRLQWLHDKRVEEADNIVRYVFNQCKNGGGLVNVRLASQQYTGNVIRRLLFNRRYFGKGSEDGSPGPEEIEHVHFLFELPKFLFSFSISDYVPLLREFDLDGHKKNTKRAVSILSKYQNPIIEDRIRQWKNGTKTDEEDLLDIVINLKDANNKPLMTEDEIKCQIMEMQFASVDNPSNSFEWALAEMLNQPEQLRKATEEMDNVVGKERLVQESDFPKLNYIKACAREAFRLHPIQDYSICHCSMTDTVIANYFIPKGSHVLLSRQGIGQNPKVWEEPLKFKPERHLKSDGSSVFLTEPSLDLITFGTGRRSCAGIALGTILTFTLFARLIHGFTWTVPPSESCIDLSESKESTVKGTPLVAFAKPRLSPQAYGIY